MSLKAFHLFFITVSVLTAFGFGAWGVYQYATFGDGPLLLLGLASVAVGAGLIVYARRFLEKIKGIKML